MAGFLEDRRRHDDQRRGGADRFAKGAVRGTDGTCLLYSGDFADHGFFHRNADHLEAVVYEISRTGRGQGSECGLKRKRWLRFFQKNLIQVFLSVPAAQTGTDFYKR